eukprot:402589-Amphidinium_carterae.1
MGQILQNLNIIPAGSELVLSHMLYQLSSGNALAVWGKELAATAFVDHNSAAGQRSFGENIALAVQRFFGEALWAKSFDQSQ